MYDEKMKRHNRVEQDTFIKLYADGTDIMDFTDMGDERAKRLTGFQLQLTNPRTKAPLYYITVKAQNGAGDFSSPMTSTPIYVEDEDVTGMLYEYTCVYVQKVIILLICLCFQKY